MNTIESQIVTKHEKSQTAKIKIAAADRLIDEGSFDAADALLLEVEGSEQFEFPTCIKRSNIAINSGRIEDARTLVDRAERIAPQSEWVAYNRALIEEFEGNTKQALIEIDTAIRRAPDKQPFKNLRKRLERIAALDAVKPGTYQRVTRGNTAVVGDAIKIICWDLSHNPAGRAIALAEVAAKFAVPEIVGPILSEGQTSAWHPLESDPHGTTYSSWQGREPAHFFAGAFQYVLENPCKKVWVSKARFPGLFIGYLYKRIHDATVVVDIDDDELAFVNAAEQISVQDFISKDTDIDWSDLSSMLWGQLAMNMAHWADSFSTCNEVLQNTYQGEIVRHARNGKVFCSDGRNRTKIRERLGFVHSDKIVLFMGTPRRHKGILEIANAIVELEDPDVVLLVVGDFVDHSLERELKTIAGLRLVLLGDQPLSSAAEINLAADLCTAFQDIDSRIAKSQTPAKLTDAAAMGRLSIASNLETISVFIKADAVITPENGETLTETLRRGIDKSVDAKLAEKIRTFFNTSLSAEANVQAAQRAFKNAESNKCELPADFDDLLTLITRRIPVFQTDAAREFFSTHTQIKQPNVQITSVEKDLDIVFFWKQNDTEIYDRRQDCVHQTLASLPNIRKILHIDAPMSADKLIGLCSSELSNSEDRLVARNTISRFLGTSNQIDVHHRSFVYSGKNTTLLGRQLDSKDMYPVRVAQWMEELGIGANALAWVCPVAPDFNKVLDVVGFQDVVADVIDNQNLWPMNPNTRRSLIKDYKHVFSACSLSFSNCESVAEWLRQSGLNPLVVPNGMHVSKNNDCNVKRPSVLSDISGPIIGYVGNMSDRIDWQLMLELIDLQPDWTFLMIGKFPRVRSEQFQRVQSRPNVLMPGVVPASQMQAWYSAMHVGLIPHLDTELSRAMNPLKLYVYRAHGLRVVSTPIQNIDDFGDEITIADGVTDTIHALANAIEEIKTIGPDWPNSDILEQLSWNSRVDTMIDHIRARYYDQQGVVSGRD